MLVRKVFSTESAKAWVALVVGLLGAAVTAVVTTLQGEGQPVPVWLLVVSSVAAAVGVWLTRNAIVDDPPDEHDEEGSGVDAL